MGAEMESNRRGAGLIGQHWLVGGECTKCDVGMCDASSEMLEIRRHTVTATSISGERWTGLRGDNAGSSRSGA